MRPVPWSRIVLSRTVLVWRLAVRDLRYRPGQAVLVLLAVTAATATLTLGLALHGVTSRPYQQTRAATNGPDVVAYLPVTHRPGRVPSPPAQAAAALTHAAGVTGHSGPYPLVGAVLRARGRMAPAQAEGRSQAPAPVDQPTLTAGRWVRAGGVVIERTFADALGVGVGDRITLNGRAFTVAGVAVTAAGIVAVLTFHATAGQKGFARSAGLGNPVYDRDEQMLAVLTIVLVTLAVFNVVVTAWATVLDARHSAALARALGATPQQVSAGVSAAQVLPALPGALLGVPLGVALFAAANGAGTQVLTVPPAWSLATAVLATLVAVAGLTMIPARVGARRPAAAILASELA